MRIALFETEHFEGAFPVIKLFDMPENQICIFTSEETYQRFSDLLKEHASRYDWNILSSRSRLRFFLSLYRGIKKQKPDILYINTVSNNHLLYAMVLWFLPVKRVVLTIHDINCLFESRFSWNVRRAIIHWGKKWLIRQTNEFNVVADTMIGYLHSKVHHKGMHNVPGAVFEHRPSKVVVEDVVKLVVPGSLDRRKRDYEKVFELAGKAHQEKLRLEIILLGGFSDNEGKALATRADVFDSGYCQLRAYQMRVVDQDEFDRKMNAAHFVFIPSVIHTKICDEIPETYGITKSSGNIFDIIKHAKPFMVPAGLVIPADLQTSCFKYDSIDDVVNFLKGFAASPAGYAHWQEQALQNSENYTIEKVRERNPSLFAP